MAKLSGVFGGEGRISRATIKIAGSIGPAGHTLSTPPLKIEEKAYGLPNDNVLLFLNSPPLPYFQISTVYIGLYLCFIHHLLFLI